MIPVVIWLSGQKKTLYQPGKLASEQLTSVRAKQQGACGDRAAHVNCFCQVSHNQAYYQVHL